MITLTLKEKQAMIILFKDFTNYHNANSLSKTLGITRIGAMKLLKKLLKENILSSKTIGKSIIYKLNLEEDYNRHLITFILADEANNFKRWKEEFKDFSNGETVVLLYGSTIRNYNVANDIDLMLIIKKEQYSRSREIINEIQEILPKKIHSIELTAEDFLKNIKEKKRPLIDTIKNAIILYGQAKYVDIMKNVSSF